MRRHVKSQVLPGPWAFRLWSKQMSKAPKRITKNEADIDRSKYYGLADAVKLVA